MNETIEKLIASGKEGPWWDFKQTYHQNENLLLKGLPQGERKSAE